MIWTNDRDCGVNPKKRWTNARDCGVNPKKKKEGKIAGFPRKTPSHENSTKKDRKLSATGLSLSVSFKKTIALFFFLLSLPEQLPSSALKGLLFPLPFLESP